VKEAESELGDNGEFFSGRLELRPW
jgi:hypothetical protein